MARFHQILVYTTVIWMFIITTNAKKSKKGEKRIAYNSHEYVKPNNSSTLRIWMNEQSGNGTIEEFIKQKVKELKPLLEDDSVKDVAENNKISLEGDNETTIIEFNPILRTIKRDEEMKAVETKAKDFQENLQKYKKLRSKIRKALKREKVTNKTRGLVTKTLDKMIAQMIAHKCLQSDKEAKDNGTKNEITNLIQSWNKEWSKLKHQFMTKNESEDPKTSKKKFLNKFQDLVSIMSNDLNTVAGKYKVVCRYEEINNNAESKKGHKGVIRTEEKKIEHQPGSKNKDENYLKVTAEKAVINKNNEETIPCSHFKICSDELMQFLLDFYITFNDTAVNVVTNYAAMFMRDVSDDSYHEKERVVKLIMNIAKIATKKAESIYRKQTKKLKLSNDKNRYENLKILYAYVENTLERFKKIIHKDVETNLKSVREKLMQIIQKDIDVNMALDLGNLEKDVNGRICHIFEVCNGVVFGSRKTNYLGDKNNVYVKVQVNFEDAEKPEVLTKTTHKKFKRSRKYPSKLIVTRTPPTINRLVLKIEPSFVQSDDIVLKAKQILVNDIKNENYENIPRTIASKDQLALNNNPSSSFRENQSKIKNKSKSEEVKVKIIFVEDNKENEETSATKVKMKRSKLRNLRKAEYMRQLALQKKVMMN